MVIPLGVLKGGYPREDDHFLDPSMGLREDGHSLGHAQWKRLAILLGVLWFGPLPSPRTLDLADYQVQLSWVWPDPRYLGPNTLGLACLLDLYYFELS
jgi:hypothetical protein